MRPLEAHPDDNELVGYLEGGLEDARMHEVRAHLDACDDCRELTAAMVRASVPKEPDGPLEPPLKRGTNLGRYVVLDPVGRGAMGVVYAAFDPELDRKVALKVVRPGLSSDKPLPAKAQLLTEAQAMARLSHPNVITVYDVGTFGDEIFFAMEFLSGGSLKALAQEKLPWRRLLGLYLEAGAGLSAAHQAGITHRDFKPDNVLLGEDGRARVTDLGLAALTTTSSSEKKLVGTPAYMAPEQWRGELVDARADQYAFCVALHEAIYGIRPKGPSPSGQAPVGKQIPSQVARTLERGLKDNPQDRWSSMPELLLALKRSARPFSPGSLAATVALVALTLFIWVWHGVNSLSFEHELQAAAVKLPELLANHHEVREARILAALKSEVVLDALAHASDIDAALGLAETEQSEREMQGAHEVLLSADLPALKSEDVLLFVNGWRRVIFNLAQERNFGQPAPPISLLVHAVEGNNTDELWSPRMLKTLSLPLAKDVHGQDLLWVSAYPVVRGRALVGVALMGHWMAPLLREMEEATHTHVVFVAPDGTSSDAAWTPMAKLRLGKVFSARREQKELLGIAVRVGDVARHTPEGVAYLLKPLGPSAARDTALALLRWAVLGLAVLAGLRLIERAVRYA